MQGNFNLGIYDSYQAEMSFPLLAANPCICQGTLWVCYFLDWIWFNCPELHHRVKTLPSVTLEDTQIWPAVMKSSLLPLGSCSSKGSFYFLPMAVLNQIFLEVCSQQPLELIFQFRFSSSLVLWRFLLKKTKIFSPLEHVTDILLGLLCWGPQSRWAICTVGQG